MYLPTTNVQRAARYRRAQLQGNRQQARTLRHAMRQQGAGSTYLQAALRGRYGALLAAYYNPPRSMPRAQWQYVQHAVRALANPYPYSN